MLFHFSSTGHPSIRPFSFRALFPFPPHVCSLVDFHSFCQVPGVCFEITATKLGHFDLWLLEDFRTF